MKDILSLFTTPILMTQLDYHVDKIETLCQQERSKNPEGTQNSNVGGWHSGDINYPDSPFFFLSDIEKECQEYARDILKADASLCLQNAWININSKRDFNQTHDHAGAVLSGVYYIKTPKDCGNIKFLHPAHDLIERDWIFSLREYHPFNSCLWWLPANEGSLYIFPSWLKHRVEPNMSDEERISISFNVGEKREL